MRREEELAPPDWRDALSVNDDGERTTLHLKATGEAAGSALRRLAAEGRWDASTDPSLAALFGLAAELIETTRVTGWIGEALMLHHEGDDAKSVRACFEVYQQAIADDDGPAAAAVLDAATMNRYAAYRDAALDGRDAIAGSDTPLMDRLCIAIFRMHLTQGQLIAMSPREIVEFAIEHGMIGKQGTGQISIGAIEVCGETAYAETFAEGQRVPCDLVFRREADRWRLDVTALLPFVEKTYRSVAEMNQLSDDAFVETVLRSVSREQPGG